MEASDIVPPRWERELGRGGYRMTFVPWVLREENSGFYLPLLAGHYVILDTELFERAAPPPSAADIARAAQLVHATEVVLPDTLGDAEATLRDSLEALEHLPKGVGVMFVPQARSREDWEWSLARFVAHYSATAHSIPVVGLSSLRHKQGLRPLKGSRIPMIEHLYAQRLPGHLLGMASTKLFLDEELPAALDYDILSIDTCAAFALGARGLVLSRDSPRLFLGNLDRYETLTTSQLDLIKLNMDTLDQWVEE